MYARLAYIVAVLAPIAIGAQSAYPRRRPPSRLCGLKRWLRVLRVKRSLVFARPTLRYARTAPHGLSPPIFGGARATARIASMFRLTGSAFKFTVHRKERSD